jgi:hypothetical protein
VQQEAHRACIMPILTSKSFWHSICNSICKCFCPSEVFIIWDLTFFKSGSETDGLGTTLNLPKLGKGERTLWILIWRICDGWIIRGCENRPVAKMVIRCGGGIRHMSIIPALNGVYIYIYIFIYMQPLIPFVTIFRLKLVIQMNDWPEYRSNHFYVTPRHVTKRVQSLKNHYERL